MTMSHYCNC